MNTWNTHAHYINNRILKLMKVKQGVKNNLVLVLLDTTLPHSFLTTTIIFLYCEIGTKSSHYQTITTPLPHITIKPNHSNEQSYPKPVSPTRFLSSPTWNHNHHHRNIIVLLSSRNRRNKDTSFPTSLFFWVHNRINNDQLIYSRL